MLLWVTDENSQGARDRASSWSSRCCCLVVLWRCCVSKGCHARSNTVGGISYFSLVCCLLSCFVLERGIMHHKARVLGLLVISLEL